MTTANASSQGYDRYRFGSAVNNSARITAFIKTHITILGVGLTLLLAGIGATWHVTNKIHDGDMQVRESMRHSEQLLREEIAALRDDLNEGIERLQSEAQANYRDLRDRMEESR